MYGCWEDMPSIRSTLARLEIKMACSGQKFKSSPKNDPIFKPFCSNSSFSNHSLTFIQTLVYGEQKEGQTSCWDCFLQRTYWAYVRHPRLPCHSAKRQAKDKCFCWYGRGDSRQGRGKCRFLRFMASFRRSVNLRLCTCRSLKGSMLLCIPKGFQVSIFSDFYEHLNFFDFL